MPTPRMTIEHDDGNDITLTCPEGGRGRRVVFLLSEC